MARKEFTYRGKTLPELKQMSLKEFGELCGTRAKRSLNRGFNQKILKRIEGLQGKDNPKPIRTHKRDLIVIPQMIGLTFMVYRGNEFVRIDVKPKMLGHYIGEFALSRKKLAHGKAGIGATKSSTAITAK